MGDGRELSAGAIEDMDANPFGRKAHRAMSVCGAALTCAARLAYRESIVAAASGSPRIWQMASPHAAVVAAALVRATLPSARERIDGKTAPSDHDAASA